MFNHLLNDNTYSISLVIFVCKMFRDNGFSLSKIDVLCRFAKKPSRRGTTVTWPGKWERVAVPWSGVRGMEHVILIAVVSALKTKDANRLWLCHCKERLGLHTLCEEYLNVFENLQCRVDTYNMLSFG